MKLTKLSSLYHSKNGKKIVLVLEVDPKAELSVSNIRYVHTVSGRSFDGLDTLSEYIKEFKENTVRYKLVKDVLTNAELSKLYGHDHKNLDIEISPECDLYTIHEDLIVYEGYRQYPLSDYISNNADSFILCNLEDDEFDDDV